MRKLLFTALAGVLAGGALTAGPALAQPYYSAAPRYDPYYDGAYRAPVAPAYDGRYGYYDYGRYDDGAAGLAGSVLGAAIGGLYGSAVPVDRFGPDPNGMIAPDGHRIKCKLRSNWDSYRQAYVRQRECW